MPALKRGYDQLVDDDPNEGWTGYAPLNAPIPRCALCGLSAVVPPGPGDPRFEVGAVGAICETCAGGSAERFRRWDRGSPPGPPAARDSRLVVEREMS